MWAITRVLLPACRGLCRRRSGDRELTALVILIFCFCSQSASNRSFRGEASGLEKSARTTVAPIALKRCSLSQCAYRLGVAFGHEAERAEDLARKLENFHLFDRCFFAVRVATALELRLLRAPAAGAWREDHAERDERPERGEAPEQDRPDPDRIDRDEDADRDREREVEPATLPVLLRTLEGVAGDAAALAGPEPAALPTLRELLAQVTANPNLAAPPRSAGGGLRARLAGSATAAVMTLPPHSRPGLADGLPLRRATGPPRR